jgi:hypothetical protein
MTWIYVLLAAVVVGGFFAFLWRKQRELERSIEEVTRGRRVRFTDRHALYIARESDGYAHLRGTGVLLLTDDLLYFEQQLTRKAVSIPLSSITRVGETLRLGGQSTGRPMLRVEFRNAEGAEDAIGLRVRELERWKREIEGAGYPR